MPRSKPRPRNQKPLLTHKQAGGSLLGLSFFMLLLNLSDDVGKWQNWWYASTPEFVGEVMWQVATVGIAAFGGKLLPSRGER